MINPKRKSLDELSNESERLELLFEQCIRSSDDAGRSRLVTEIAEWLKECVAQGRFVPSASVLRTK